MHPLPATTQGPWRAGSCGSIVQQIACQRDDRCPRRDSSFGPGRSASSDHRIVGWATASRSGVSAARRASSSGKRRSRTTPPVTTSLIAASWRMCAGGRRRVETQALGTAGGIVALADRSWRPCLATSLLFIFTRQGRSQSVRSSRTVQKEPFALQGRSPPTSSAARSGCRWCLSPRGGPGTIRWPPARPRRPVRPRGRSALPPTTAVTRAPAPAGLPH
jgi:hypothetical protein